MPSNYIIPGCWVNHLQAFFAYFDAVQVTQIGAVHAKIAVFMALSSLLRWYFSWGLSTLDFSTDIMNFTIYEILNFCSPATFNLNYYLHLSYALQNISKNTMNYNFVRQMKYKFMIRYCYVTLSKDFDIIMLLIILDKHLRNSCPNIDFWTLKSF